MWNGHRERPEKSGSHCKKETAAPWKICLLSRGGTNASPIKRTVKNGIRGRLKGGGRNGSRAAIAAKLVSAQAEVQNVSSRWGELKKGREHRHINGKTIYTSQSKGTINLTSWLEELGESEVWGSQ